MKVQRLLLTTLIAASFILGGCATSTGSHATSSSNMNKPADFIPAGGNNVD